MSVCKKVFVFLALVLAAAAIGVVDLLTPERVDLEILYFIPITIAAWVLGREWAYAIAAVDVFPAYVELSALAAVGEIPIWLVAMDIVVLLLVYGFVAELVYRLVRSRRELSQSYQLREFDLRAASALQAAVLENPIPEVPGYRIAARLRLPLSIGGDFWEVICRQNHLHMVMGDVTGKGIQASLFTTLLKHLLDESRDLFTDPRDIAVYVNEQLRKRLPEGMFVSLFYGCLNLGSGELVYVNAGQEPPLLHRRDSDDFEELPSSAIVMGIQDYPEPPKRLTADLHAGDILVSYTDGVTDARLPSGERLGMDFLRRMVRELKDSSADEIVDGILERISAETEDSTPDDRAILCLKVNAD